MISIDWWVLNSNQFGWNAVDFAFIGLSYFQENSEVHERHKNPEVSAMPICKPTWSIIVAVGANIRDLSGAPTSLSGRTCLFFEVYIYIYLIVYIYIYMQYTCTWRASQIWPALSISKGSKTTLQQSANFACWPFGWWFQVSIQCTLDKFSKYLGLDLGVGVGGSGCACCGWFLFFCRCPCGTAVVFPLPSSCVQKGVNKRDASRHKSEDTLGTTHAWSHCTEKYAYYQTSLKTLQ